MENVYICKQKLNYMSNYRFQIEQYHSIGKADIAINGITVLAGVNGAGKSTLARWLYYIVNFSAIYDKNRFEEFYQVFVDELRQYSSVLKDMAESDGLAESISNAKRTIQETDYNGIESVKRVLTIYFNATTQFCDYLNEALAEVDKNRLIRIINYLHIETQEHDSVKEIIRKYHVSQISKGEFEENRFLKIQKERPIGKFYEKAKRLYKEIDYPKNLHFQEDGVDIISKEKIGDLLGLDDAIYIDTPMALSVIDSTNQFWKDLRYMLVDSVDKADGENAIKTLLAQVRSITGGETSEKKDITGQEELLFTRKSDNLRIKLENVATGIKSFAYIERLLQNGRLTDSTILIIDEPEAHLHPQWIVEFARLLVLLNKKVGLKIMIASHDPDMVSAIRYVAEAEGVLSNTNFYIAEEKGNSQTYIYKDLGNDIEPIFLSFNKSYELIEKYGIDNG